MHVILARLLSRKFLLALFSLVFATFLVYGNHIADGVYSAIVIAIVGSYIAGNVTQKATSKESQ